MRPRILLACVLLLACVAVFAADVLSPIAATPGQPVQAERYVPDPDRLFPAPGPRAPSPSERQQVVYAESIVLQGRDVQIVITANGQRPGITMTHRSGHSQQFYFHTDGRAVIGIREPNQAHFSAALWAQQGIGVLQMRDARGTYLMQPANIYQGASVR